MSRKRPLPEHSTKNTKAVFIVTARLKAVAYEITKTQMHTVISILLKEGKEYTVFALLLLEKIIQDVLNTANELHDFYWLTGLKGVLPADVRARVSLKLVSGLRSFTFLYPV